MKWLVEHGVAADRLTAKGFGATQPIMVNLTATGRAANRRVEFHIIETDAQYMTLVELGCLYGQGYLFGRPQPASLWLERASAYSQVAD